MANVLVVDDDPAVSEIMSGALRHAGHAAEWVLGDTSAYRRITALPTLDALILDINLGEGTTGYDVARFARAVIPRIAVVYVSGDAERDSLTAHGVPGSEFLVKPFLPSELVEALDRQIRLRSDAD